MQRGNVTVVVVGAGMAGLSAANDLLQAGFSKTMILEASNRVGGRIMSVQPKEGEGIVELGATCIHGASAENPIYKLATDWGMTDSLTLLNRISGCYYQENGEILDTSLVEQVWEHYLQMEIDMEEISNKSNTKTLASSTSMAQYMEQARPNILQHFKEGEVREAAGKLLNLTYKFCQFINGDELSLLSADLCGQYKTISGPEMIFTGKGYGGFVEELQKKIPEDVIHLNKEVATVQWGNNAAKIICRDGSEYMADHVILTCPLGYLKANYKEMFDPQLPSSKAGAIERIGFGHVAKLFLYYDQPFWTHGRIRLVQSHHSKPIIEGSQWTKGLFAFDEYATNPKVIGGPFGGMGAEIMEQLSDEEVSKTCTDLLRRFTGDPTIPEPTRVLRSSWNSDSLYNGAYSYLSMNSRENDIKDLALPVPDDRRPVLLFAGEATHQDFYSTVHGAYMSGVRESQRLAELYSL